MLGNKPLIAYTIGDALAIEGITKVFVTTDDPEIQAVSIECGAEVPFLRPRELAQDNSVLDDAIRYSYDWYRENENFVADIQIIMSPTHPFRRSSLIGNALKSGIENKQIFNIGSISPVCTNLNNYWALDNGKLTRFEFPFNGNPPTTNLYQSAFSFNIVFNNRTELLNRRIPVVLNGIESIDIDEPGDLEIARMVVKKGLYPFDY
jgi:CMP-N-acetylneuraminic acid synthetase